MRMCELCGSVRRAEKLDLGAPEGNSCFKGRSPALPYRPLLGKASKILLVTCRNFSHVKSMTVRWDE